MKWIRILLNSDVTDGEDFVTKIKVEGKTFCLVRYNDKFYATQAKCPHAGADLSFGWCKQGKLICPYHRYSYDLETGKGSEGQGDYINIYPIEVRKDGVYVGLPERKGWLKKLFRLW